MSKTLRPSVYLILHGDELIPAEVTRRLGIQPSESHLKGEVKQVKGWQRSTPLPVVTKSGLWSLDLEGTTHTAAHLVVEEILALVGGYHGSLRDLPGVTRVVLSLYVSSEVDAGDEIETGVMLSTRQIERVERLGCELNIALTY